MLKIETFICGGIGCQAAVSTATGYQSLLMLGWEIREAKEERDVVLRCPLHSEVSPADLQIQIDNAKVYMRVLYAAGEGPLHVPEIEKLLRKAVFVLSAHPVHAAPPATNEPGKST